MGRPSNSLQRRAEIIAALGDVMSRRGYAGATIVEIARSAGLTSGLVHYHFPDKHAILLGLGEALASTIDRRYRSRLAIAKSPSERLDAFIDAHVALDADADASAVAAWAAVGAEAQRDPQVRVVYSRHIRASLTELARLFESALRHDRRQMRDVRGKAAAVLAAIEGAFRLAVSAPGSTPVGFASDGIRRLAAALVAAEPRSAELP